MSYWSILERDLLLKNCGIGRFCRLEFQRMANWPSFEKNRKWGELYGAGGLFRAITQFRACKIGQSQYEAGGLFCAIHPVSSLKNRPVPLDSSRKLMEQLNETAGDTFQRAREKKACERC